MRVAGSWSADRPIASALRADTTSHSPAPSLTLPSRLPFPPISLALRSSVFLLTLFLAFLFLSLPLPSSSQSSHASTHVTQNPHIHSGSNTQDPFDEESPQAPLAPHSASNATTLSSPSLMGEPGKRRAGEEEAEVLGEDGSREVKGEASFWLFELLVLIALIPSVIGLQKRKQYVMALHNRRLDRMVNS